MANVSASQDTVSARKNLGRKIFTLTGAFGKNRTVPILDLHNRLFSEDSSPVPASKTHDYANPE